MALQIPKGEGFVALLFLREKGGRRKRKLICLNSRAMEWKLKKWGDEIQWWHRLLNERKEMVGP